MLELSRQLLGLVEKLLGEFVKLLRLSWQLFGLFRHVLEVLRPPVGLLRKPAQLDANRTFIFLFSSVIKVQTLLSDLNHPM